EHTFVSSTAAILHADADAFFASVEQRDDPALRGRPTIVGTGVVMAASYEARAHGIRGGMGGRRAQRLCPGAVFVEPRFSAYVEASGALFEIFERTAPVVEGISLEEAFLDVNGLDRISGTPRQIAERLRREVREEVGLAVTVGVARTKVLAKMASRAAKPDGLLVITPEQEASFLEPLPVEALWGVGAVTAERLHAWGIHDVGELGRRDPNELKIFLGWHAARHLHAIAHNRDPRRVRRGRRRRSIGSQSAFGRGHRTRADLDALLVTLVDRVMRRLRAKDRAGRTVTLRLRFDDYSRATRSRTLSHPTAGTGAVLAAARVLLDGAIPMIERRGISLLGITVANLTDHAQLELPLDRPPDAALDAAMDEIRERFGTNAIRRGSTRPSSPRHVTQV
ncbi:MAG TPA: DNA polymerase IV, partial [Solirubrobacterales bacterium]|nr:DNA polymerase IV [Solirubrobacterales bacterium]